MGVEGSNRSRKEAVDAASLDHGPNDTRNATVQMHPRGRCRTHIPRKTGMRILAG